MGQPDCCEWAPLSKAGISSGAETGTEREQRGRLDGDGLTMNARTADLELGTAISVAALPTELSRLATEVADVDLRSRPGAGVAGQAEQGQPLRKSCVLQSHCGGVWPSLRWVRMSIEIKIGCRRQARRLPMALPGKRKASAW